MLTRRITIVLSLIAIVVGIILIASITIKIPTTIDDIQKHPDRYVDKRVTIIGETAGLRGGNVTYHNLKGFWLEDTGSSDKSFPSPFPREIFVNYIGDIPSFWVKDKWGRQKRAPDVRVIGIVRHKPGFFYIEGESWEYKR